MSIQKIGCITQKAAQCIQKKPLGKISHLSKSPVDIQRLQYKIDHCDCCMLSSDKGLSPQTKSKLEKIIATSSLRTII